MSKGGGKGNIKVESEGDFFCLDVNTMLTRKARHFIPLSWGKVRFTFGLYK